MKIVIIDYGMGNIHSLSGALNFLGMNQVIVSNQEKEILSADKIILPGVGAFNMAMKNIKKNNLDKYLNIVAFQKKIPILGICLGMQLMGLSSTEHGVCDGLGYIPGKVNAFDSKELKVPHVGFNQVIINSNLRLYRGMSNIVDFYFTHSFKMESNADINPCFCDYGSLFIASYERDNIAGVQFHPELSQKNGLKLLKNFLERF
ncbi:MAG: imidazole glycerol phosphate synthase subunit HisH [Gammaproteobacteria bacterium]|nr:imidazole glycerol phosphate synthase subunit HisH [Gammaproteobacteria bacterium]